MKKITNWFKNTFFPKYERRADGLKFIRDKEKPWLCWYSPTIWDELTGYTRYGGFLDTSHPRWIAEVLMPTIEGFKRLEEDGLI